MADFSFLSDTDDSAVEELLSEVQDLCVLEQVSAINCSGFSDSDLPTDLESRFRKLKSFPATNRKLNASNPRPSASSTVKSLSFDSKTQPNRSEALSGGEERISSPSKHIPDENVGSRPNSRSGFSPSLSDSLDFSEGNVNSVTGKENLVRNKSAKHVSKSGYDLSSNSRCSSDENEEIVSPVKPRLFSKKFSEKSSNAGPFSSSPLSHSNSFSSSPSPPRKTGCFWCSPKKASQKKSKENRLARKGLSWSKDDELLSDLSIFSSKEQQKILKKAMKEEQKISQEAEKIVKWAKQASARLNVSGIEDELDDEDAK